MAKELSALEQLKASRNPLRVIDDVYKEAQEGIPLKDEHIGLLKWYGMYPHVNTDGTLINCFNKSKKGTKFFGSFVDESPNYFSSKS